MAEPFDRQLHEAVLRTLDVRLSEGLRQAACSFAETGTDFGFLGGMWWLAYAAMDRHIDHAPIVALLRREYGDDVAASYEAKLADFKQLMKNPSLPLTGDVYPPPGRLH